MVFRYSRWDGTQNPWDLDEEELLDQMAESLYEHGDAEQALRDLFRRGMQGRNQQGIPGLRDLMEQLRDRRQSQLQRYDVDSVMADIQERLQEVVDKERAGAERSLEQAQKRLEFATPKEQEQFQNLMDVAQKRTEDTLQKLDELPESAAGQVRELSEHDFIDDEAREKFQELMDMLRGKMMNNVVQQTADQLRNMTPEQQRAMRDMLKSLNEMLRQRAQGQEPDFDGFMQQYGGMFGSDPPGSLDELLDRLQQQMAQMQSLFNSMSPEQQQELADLMQQSLDPETLQEMAQLASMVNRMRPIDQMASEYPFMGEESVTLDQAMDLMSGLQELDQLEQQLRQAGMSGDIDQVDPSEVERLLGEEYKQALEQLKEIARRLEEEGVIQRLDDGTWELTPRAIRKLGEKALREVFGRLGKGGLGGHRINQVGYGGDRTGDTKPFEFGEPLDLNLHETLRNAVTRQGNGVPVQLKVADFEVDRFEYMSDAATVLLLDQSSSTRYAGRWGAAKKVAMALQALIQGQFPRDRLFLVGFSDYAREIPKQALAREMPNFMVQGTNMHHALMLSRKMLSKEKAGTRQVIMITDGEPTAHLENGYSYFDYPPSRRTVLETLKEVKKCTAAGIIINTFMLEKTSYLSVFIDYVTRINRGRAFYTSPESLGDYVLVDFVSNRRQRVA